MPLVTRRQARINQEHAIADRLDNQTLSSATQQHDAKSTASSASSSNLAADSSIVDSDSDDESRSISGSSQEDDSEIEEDLDLLFEKSLKACQARDEANGSLHLTFAFDINADQVHLVENGPTPTTKIVEKPATVYGKQKALPSDPRLNGHFERLKRGDDLGEGRPKSATQQKRERRREKEKTAGSQWFDLPAFPKASNNKPANRRVKGAARYPSNGPTAEEMKREVQAIRLRNAMDPKRFYRGGNGTGDKGMPAFAQMGRIISSNLEPAATLTRSERGKTIIDELVKDAQNAAYTKRKFAEQQARTDVGRSSHISRRKGSNTGKRQRK